MSSHRPVVFRLLPARFHKDKNQKDCLMGECKSSHHFTFCSKEFLEDDIWTNPQHQHQGNQVNDHIDGNDLHLACAFFI